jgi:hypothetical protein
MGGQACKAKVILNGGMIQSATHELCYLVDEVPYEDFPEKEGLEIVDLLNRAENLVFKAQRVFLESQGFQGPWPKSLD